MKKSCLIAVIATLAAIAGALAAVAVYLRRREKELDEYEREIKRRLWRRRIKAAWTYFSAAIIGAIGAFILGVAKALITNFS